MSNNLELRKQNIHMCKSTTCNIMRNGKVTVISKMIYGRTWQQWETAMDKQNTLEQKKRTNRSKDEEKYNNTT
jgi:hypothetical protein